MGQPVKPRAGGPVTEISLSKSVWPQGPQLHPLGPGPSTNIKAPGDRVTAEGLSGRGSVDHSSDTHDPPVHQDVCRGKEGASRGLGATGKLDDSAHLLSLPQKQNL